MKKNIEIENVHACEVLDSRGNPTIEVEVKVKDGEIGRAIIPSGASTGKNEALELRDSDKNRYNGKGVIRAVNNVNDCIAPKITGMNALNQQQIDETMINIDGTENKSKLGANSIFGVSLAVARVSSKNLKIPLYQYLGGIYGKTIPTPMMNILNGGKHANNNLNIQEFMIVPMGKESFRKKLRMCVEVYNELKKILKEEKLSTSVGDEGGFAPNLQDEEIALQLIESAILNAGYTDNFKIALDIAASEMFENGEYNFWKKGDIKSTDEMIEFYSNLVSKYPIISIEDPLGEEDWEGWQKITKLIGNKIQIVGDDLYTTNVNRLMRGVIEKSSNSILIKPNQIGTLTETLETIKYAKNNNFTTIISHRSGETEDTFISDLGVGLNMNFIKSGAPCRIDRIAKYNRLLRIEEELLKK